MTLHERGGWFTSGCTTASVRRASKRPYFSIPQAPRPHRVPQAGDRCRAALGKGSIGKVSGSSLSWVDPAPSPRLPRRPGQAAVQPGDGTASTTQPAPGTEANGEPRAMVSRRWEIQLLLCRRWQKTGQEGFGGSSSLFWEAGGKGERSRALRCG